MSCDWKCITLLAVAFLVGLFLIILCARARSLKYNTGGTEPFESALTKLTSGAWYRVGNEGETIRIWFRVDQGDDLSGSLYRSISLLHMAAKGPDISRGVFNSDLTEFKGEHGTAVSTGCEMTYRGHVYRPESCTAC